MVSSTDRAIRLGEDYAEWDEWRFQDGAWTAEHTLYNGEMYQAVVSHFEDHDGFRWTLLFNGMMIACGEDSSAEDGRQSCLAALMMAMKLRKPLIPKKARLAP